MNKKSMTNRYNPNKFQPPFERYYLQRIVCDGEVAMVSYTDVKKGTFKKLTKFGLHCEDANHQKQELLLLACVSDWDIVTRHIKSRPSVKEKGLHPEKGLAQQLDTDKYINPYIFHRKEDGSTHKPILVKVILRNGLVVTCKLLRQDRYNIIARCKDADPGERALIMIFKHGILSVEPIL